jgi:UDP-2,3-diacylglucosamine pyrophosphatase LpxH
VKQSARKINLVGIINDIHFPFQDRPALDRALAILKENRPDMIVVDGDLLDCYEASKYERIPNFGRMLKDEIPMGRDFLEDLRQDHPDAIIKYVEGNHEFRVKNYVLRNAPAVFDADFLFNQLHLRPLGIEWVSTKDGAAKWTDTFFDLEGIKIGHFDRVNAGAGMTVKSLMTNKGGSFVQAHVHRAAIRYFTNINGDTTFGMESPCLCLPPHYGNITDWQRGLSFLERTSKGILRPRLEVF